MKKIRVLRDFTSSQAVGVDNIILKPREPGKPYPRVESIIVERKAVFTAGEEVGTLEVPVDGKYRLVAADLGKRQNAILDGAVKGKDFEFIK